MRTRDTYKISFDAGLPQIFDDVEPQFDEGRCERDDVDVTASDRPRTVCSMANVLLLGSVVLRHRCIGVGSRLRQLGDGDGDSYHMRATAREPHFGGG